jgi:hypothetical protein
LTAGRLDIPCAAFEPLDYSAVRRIDLRGEDEIMGRMVVGLTASCAKQEQKAPETSTTTTTTTTTTPATPSAPASVAPTEKSINPTGGNLFTPTVKAPQAPTAIPGDH